MKFQNKVVVITGASSGMGEHITKTMLAQGGTVYGCGIEDKCNIKDDKMFYKKVNITSFDECKAFIDHIASKENKIDILINAAGITTEGNLEETSVEDFNRTFNVNVNGTFYMCKNAIPHMKNHNSAIINIASDLGAKPAPHRVAYAPSKAAIISLTEAVAIDYAPNVRANIVMPGLVDTPMIQKRFDEVENPEELRKLYESFYLSNRIGTVEDITNAVLYLASDDSSFITGEKLAVCGGSLIK